MVLKAMHLLNLFSKSLWEIQSFLPKELSWPRAGFSMIWAIFHQSIDVVQPIWETGTCSLPLLCVCLLLFLVHFQGIAMMRTQKGGICQCIKNVEKRLRVKCNYTDREMGNGILRSSSGRRESEELSFPCTTFNSLWQSRKKKQSAIIS